MPITVQRSDTPKIVAQWLGLFLACAAGAVISSVNYTLPALFPVAAGVAFAGLVILGTRFFSAVFFAELVVALLQGSNPFIAILFAVANTLQAYVGATVLRTLHFDPLLRRTRDVFSLIFVALSASTIVPTMVWLVFDLSARQTGHGLPISWLQYWIGHIWALLIAAPFFIRWLAKPFFERTNQEIIETVLAFIALCAIDYVLAWTPYTSLGDISIVYLVLVPLFWIALRLGARFLTLALALTSAITLLGVAFGPYAQTAGIALGERLFQMEVFLIVIALIYYLVMGLDEERRYAVVALRKQLKRIEGAFQRISSEDKAKSEFLAILAHELRNPLAPLVSGIELLNVRDDLPPDAIEIIDMMEGRVQIMKRLLDDLLEISRISRNKVRLKKSIIDLNTVLRRSIPSINEFEVEKTHTYTLVVPQEPVYVEADEVRVEQMIINLLKNAVKYSDPGCHVSIVLALNKDSVTLRIKDDGIGIHRDMLERIFDPFNQIDPEGARSGETGLGVGLWLTKMLVELHNGSIWATSAGLGAGSEFFLVLPAFQGERPVVAANAPTAAVMAKNRARKILVVDDNAPAAESMQKLLEHRGHVAQVALSGIEAVNMCAAFQPDMVLLDIGLPDMDGYDVARILRAVQGYNGRLIALTGYGLDDDKEKAYDAGFDYHLTKPVSLKDVEAVIAKFSA